MKSNTILQYSDNSGIFREVYSPKNKQPIYTLVIEVTINAPGYMNTAFTVMVSSKGTTLPNFFSGTDNFRYGLQGLGCIASNYKYFPITGTVNSSGSGTTTLVGVAYAMTSSGSNALEFLLGNGSKINVPQSSISFSSKVLGYIAF